MSLIKRMLEEEEFFNNAYDYENRNMSLARLENYYKLVMECYGPTSNENFQQHNRFIQSKIGKSEREQRLLPQTGRCFVCHEKRVSPVKV